MRYAIETRSEQGFGIGELLITALTWQRNAAFHIAGRPVAA
ncbi:hypothetical protein [Paraburkholderia sp. CNPSo 3272]|nr:hypothetical protein [Paraburkholderia sp. CNPSo 3272]